MAVFITGGAGFIGPALANEFLAAGYDVLAFDRYPPNDKILRAWGDRVHFVQGDIRDRDLVRSLIKESGTDPVVHLAGILTAGCDRDPDLALAVNVMGMRTVLEGAREFGMRRVVMASTIGVYGQNLPQPIKESWPTEPDGWYGVTKLMSEQMGLLYVRRHGLDFRAVRFAAVTGPGRTAGSGSASLFTSFIPEMAAKGLPYEIEVEPDVIYPVVYIKDAVNALFRLATVEQAPRRIYNIGSGRIVTSEMVAAVKARLPEAQFTYKPDPVIMSVVRGYRDWEIDCTAAAEDLGWRPAYSAEQMVDDIITTVRQG
ncbi:MAG: NAD(P)-dependent oxidoreductase [Chloroflexi bacterium]|nr:NAD(P)-dependent oxidoreductase [Chloroflexota bacterium]